VLVYKIMKKGIGPMAESMLTTIDNPFNPFTQFDEWYAYDESKGYHSCSYLARIAKLSNELSPADEAVAIESAINEIVQYNINGLYKKITLSDAA